MSKYLFLFHYNTYNNEQPHYELEPLPQSDINKAIVFAGDLNNKRPFDRQKTFLYLETSKPLSSSNMYSNLYRISNLLLLTTGLPSDAMEHDISNLSNFEAILKKYKAQTFYEKGINYGGMVNEHNPIGKLAFFCKLLQKLTNDELLRFEKALQTFVWAQEIQRLPNPHLKYTLYMTLLLSSINQLADDLKKLASSVECPHCGKKINRKSRTTHTSEIEKLIRGLITGSNVDIAVKMVKKLYHDLRSSFLHDGLLAGGEWEGGFLGGVKNEKELVENMANLTILNRILLLSFVQNRIIKT